jgi:hypothetical protein
VQTSLGKRPWTPERVGATCHTWTDSARLRLLQPNAGTLSEAAFKKVPGNPDYKVDYVDGMAKNKRKDWKIEPIAGFDKSLCKKTHGLEWHDVPEDVISRAGGKQIEGRCVVTGAVEVDPELLKVCPWLQATWVFDQLECMDGTFCSGWACCENHGGRLRCPANYPHMCQHQTCGGDGGGYCCSSGGCSSAGGLRECTQQAAHDDCSNCVNAVDNEPDGCHYDSDFGACVNAAVTHYCYQVGTTFSGPVTSCEAEALATLVLQGTSVTTDISFASNYPNNRYDTTSLGFDTEDVLGHIWSLIVFDIPSTVTNPTAASLEIYIHNTGSSGILHEMIVEWGASSTFSSVGMTGTGKGNTGVWNSATVADVQGSGTPLVLDVTSSVQDWQSGASPNYGWIFEPTGSDGVDFYSSSGSVPPKLTITYNDSVSKCSTTIAAALATLISIVQPSSEP